MKPTAPQKPKDQILPRTIVFSEISLVTSDGQLQTILADGAIHYESKSRKISRDWKAKPEDMGMSSDRLERVSAKIQEYIDDDLTPGVETIIVRNGHIIYHKVQGNKRIESNTPLMKNDIFRVASMTKPIASVA